MFRAGRPCQASSGLMGSGGEQWKQARGLGHQSHPCQLPPFGSVVNSRNSSGSYYVASPELCSGAPALNTTNMADITIMELGSRSVVGSLRILQVLNALLSPS